MTFIPVTDAANARIGRILRCTMCFGGCTQIPRLALAAVLFVTAANAALIPVTGSGEFARDWTRESGTSVHFSGTDGVHSVALYAELYSPYNDTFQNGYISASTYSPFFGNGGAATIDELTSSRFRFSLSNGSGYVDIFAKGQEYSIIAHVDVLCYVRITDQATLNPGPFYSTSGSFVVTSVPEPATFGLFGAALLLYGGYGLRRRANQHIASRH